MNSVLSGYECLFWEFPGGLVVRTPYFHCWGCKFVPCSGNLRSCMLCGAAKEIIVIQRMYVLWNWELNCVDLMVEDKEALSSLPTNIGFEVLRPQKHVGHHCDYNGCGGEGWGERVVQGFEMDRYTVLSLKWITNKGLLYSTDNCSMLCGRLDGSRVWGRMDTCICMAESLHCSPETITALLIG